MIFERESELERFLQNTGSDRMLKDPENKKQMKTP